MRHNRSQRGSTRSHHALKGIALTKCVDCNSAVMRHQACSNCGKYRGKVIVNLEAKQLKAKKKSDKKSEAK
jgi:ribosomal protein L32